MTRTVPTLTQTSAYGVTVVSDGDTTHAEVNVKFSPFSSLHVLGEGLSRRRKGDTRDRDLGELIALKRAFDDASANIVKEIAARGYNTEDV